MHTPSRVPDHPAADHRVQISPPTFADRLKQDRIPVLDGVRAVALLTVVAMHVPAGPSHLLPGPLALTQFFVLSGFLITWLLLKEWDAAGTVSLRAFWLRRALRIVPAYALFLLAWYVGYTLAGRPPQGWEVAAGATWTVNYVQAFGHRVTGLEHAWSLGVEEQFYLLWPPLLVFLLARGGRRRAAAVLAGLIVTVFAWRTYLVLVRGAPVAYAYDAFDTRFDALALGSLVAVLSQGRRFGRVAAVLGRRAWMPLVTLAVVLAWQQAPLRLRFGPGFTLDALLLSVLLVQLVMLAETRAWRPLAWKPVLFLGRISYSVYLFHPGALAIAASLTTLPVTVRVALGLALSGAAGLTSWYLVETPFLRLKDRLSSARPAVPPAPAPLILPVASAVAGD